VRIFYATDVHGSDRCFTKFVNAGKFYGVDAVVLGGDITGKAIVPLTATGDGSRRGRFLGEEVVAAEGEPLEELEKKIANTGYYAWRCTGEEEQAVRDDPAAQEQLFLRLICERVERWLALADERLRPEGIGCYVNAGNDDPAEIDRIFDDAGWVKFLEGRVVELADGTEMASCGFANRTPWDCPRDVEEEELARRYEAAISGLREPGQAIFNFHCPPYDTGIDSGPRLNEELRMRSGAGGVDMHPVGSTACRAAIERHQPLLGLHGHLHESRGTYKLGRTLCINPGSEYTEGVLRGSLIEVRKGKVKSQQFTAG
jgi:Icc-related predicted phosphoesterase